jgi:hypothetical protein
MHRVLALFMPLPALLVPIPSFPPFVVSPLTMMIFSISLRKGKKTAHENKPLT